MKSVTMLATTSTRAVASASSSGLRTAAARSQFVSLTAHREINPLRSLSRPVLASYFPRSHARTFVSSPSFRIVLSPTEPKAPKTEPSGGKESHEQISISDAEYHEVADQYLNTLQQKLEEIVDSDVQKGLEVEFSAGVLTITHPSKGDYVLNKQPPNKQIWLSSPLSGPKRYDWVATQSEGGGMDTKQDSEHHADGMGDNGELGGGRWIYLRDGSSLTKLLEDEIGVIVTIGEVSDATTGREGPGASGASPASS